MQIEFIEPALLELDDAVSFYNYQEQGLGKKFFDDILETLNLISSFPDSWSRTSKNTRKAVLKRFPYNIIYSVVEGKIYVIAVAHQNRLPEYWIDRIK